MALRRFWRRVGLGATVMLCAALILAVPAAAQTTNPCQSRFADQAWVPVQEGAGLVTFRAALDEDVALRFGKAGEATAEQLSADLGTFPDTTLCLFGPDTALDPSDLVTAGLLAPGQRLHAAAFLEPAVLFVDSQQFRLVEDAVRLGMTHIALWHLTGTGYPEPLAGAVAQWYVARNNGKLEQHHANMRVFTFFGDPGGNAPPTDWFAAKQAPVLVWNPEFQENPIGDFVAAAVEAAGPEILAEPRPATWEAADVAWRAALRDELLQGADESREWVGGVVIAVIVVLGAAATAWWGRRLAKRKQEPMGEIATVEGFFDRS